MGDGQHPGIETLCVHFAENRETHLGAAAPPLYQSSTFTFPDSATFHARSEDRQRFDYTRVGNPTARLLEEKFAAMEKGEAARAFGSGMAAISAAILSCAKTGDHVVCVGTAYGPTRKLLTDYLPRFGIETTFVRGVEASEFEAATRPNTKLYYLESPSSILFEVQDLAAISAHARSRGISTICDNSNATPVYQNPLTLGVDLVVHSASKYISGHSDVIAGLVVGSTERMRSIVSLEGELLGGVADPFACWLMLRGLRTLGVRMERHSRSTAAIARLLESDMRVARVYYSGLESHPHAALARKQMRGHSGLISFTLKTPGREAAFAVVDALRYFGIAVSWGGYESLAVPLEVTDPSDGKSKWVIRISVGLESVEDLKADLYQALNAVSG